MKRGMVSVDWAQDFSRKSTHEPLRGIHSKISSRYVSTPTAPSAKPIPLPMLQLPLCTLPNLKVRAYLLKEMPSEKQTRTCGQRRNLKIELQSPLWKTNVSRSQRGELKEPEKAYIFTNAATRWNRVCYGYIQYKGRENPRYNKFRKGIPHLKSTRKYLRKCLLKASMQNYRKHEE